MLAWIGTIATANASTVSVCESGGCDYTTISAAYDGAVAGDCRIPRKLLLLNEA